MAKLTQKQWDKIKEKLDAGEKATDLAKIYKVTPQAIYGRFAYKQKQVKELANQIVESHQLLDKTLKNFTPDIQLEAWDMASDLLHISKHVAGGAKYGAMTFYRLAGIANQHAQQLDDSKPDAESLARIAGLTKVANDAAAPALNLLAANRKWTERDKLNPELQDMSEEDYMRAIEDADARLSKAQSS